MPDVPMNVSISTSTSSGDNTRTVHLRIEERISGEVLADIDIDPADMWSLLGGSTKWLEGFRTSNPQRLGKKMRHDSIKVPKEVTQGVKYGESHLAVQTWADEQRASSPEWSHVDTASAQNSNQGWKVIRRWWVEATEEDYAAEREYYR